uniref:Uncharacterized protein n=1 Tax=Monodelphis domestica TaxID=13616 RepID=A0A5F8H751_MONDO
MCRRFSVGSPPGLGVTVQPLSLGKDTHGAVISLWVPLKGSTCGVCVCVCARVPLLLPRVRRGVLFLPAVTMFPYLCPGLDASPPASTHELTIPNDVSIASLTPLCARVSGRVKCEWESQWGEAEAEATLAPGLPGASLEVTHS